jgi:hypothetical protein
MSIAFLDDMRVLCDLEPYALNEPFHTAHHGRESTLGGSDVAHVLAESMPP